MDNLENAINEAKLEFDKKLEAIYNEYLFGTIFKLKTKEYIDMNMCPDICTTLVKCLAIKNNEMRLKVIPYQYCAFSDNTILKYPISNIANAKYYSQCYSEELANNTSVEVRGELDFR